MALVFPVSSFPHTPGSAGSAGADGAPGAPGDGSLSTVQATVTSVLNNTLTSFTGITTEVAAHINSSYEARFFAVATGAMLGKVAFGTNGAGAIIGLTILNGINLADTGQVPILDLAGFKMSTTHIALQHLQGSTIDIRWWLIRGAAA